jgi:predicted ATPase
LPIIIALLKARKGDLVVVENPESHLHPSAQRVLGELISTVANADVQVIVETHSDHILNGIRVSVKNGIINHSKVQILFFSREIVSSHYYVNVYKPSLLGNGDLDIWPEGFLDEWDNALIDLLR